MNRESNLEFEKYPVPLAIDYENHDGSVSIYSKFPCLDDDKIDLFKSNRPTISFHF